MWRGMGMEQHCYTRGESFFFDHRQVALFSMRLDNGDN
jgi:hypothetical protein